MAKKSNYSKLPGVERGPSADDGPSRVPQLRAVGLRGRRLHRDLPDHGQVQSGAATSARRVSGEPGSLGPDGRGGTDRGGERESKKPVTSAY